MEIAIIITFILGYLFITLEHSININKAATALLTGVLCWTLYIISASDSHLISEQLTEHLGEIAGIIFFLMGAMTIVELIDAHDGFEVITNAKTNLDNLLSHIFSFSSIRQSHNHHRNGFTFTKTNF